MVSNIRPARRGGRVQSGVAVLLLGAGGCLLAGCGGNGGRPTVARDAGRERPSGRMDGGPADSGSTDAGPTDAGPQTPTDGGADAAQFLSCIEAWPVHASPRVASLAATPRLLWNSAVPIRGRGGGGTWAATGQGVALSVSEGYVVLAGDGSVAASGATAAGDPVSGPAAGPDGSLYFADLANVFRIDPAGSRVWQTSLGTGAAGPNEFVSPGVPLLDAAGHVVVSGLDGALDVVNREDGSVAASWPSGSSGPKPVQAGVSDVAFTQTRDPAHPNAVTAFSLTAGAPIGALSVGSPQFPTSVALLGFQIGIVATAYLDLTAETTQTVVFDPCGRPRWTVPGGYSFPLLLGFDDDLIVQDLVPAGGGQYQGALRRFSKDGVLLAGPVAFPGPRVTGAALGADGVISLVWGNGKSLVGVDSASLATVWSVPLDGTIGLEVLNQDGILFASCGLDISSAGGSLTTTLHVCAIQTPSPGPADVSWGRTAGRDERSTLWLAP
jgi:hypothetical protein